LLKRGETGDIGRNEEYGKGSQTDSRILGDMIFIEKVLGQTQERLKRPMRVEQIVSHVCKEFSLKEEELSGSGKDRRLSKVRAIAAWLVLDSGSLTLAELSKRVLRDSSTLSFAAKLLQKQAQMDTDLRQLMSKIQEGLSEIQISKACPPPPLAVGG
jgi:chromosomal replication initiation ATPase DnaA